MKVKTEQKATETNTLAYFSAVTQNSFIILTLGKGNHNKAIKWREKNKIKGNNNRFIDRDYIIVITIGRLLQRLGHKQAE
jgi:hypothetical protein